MGRLTQAAAEEEEQEVEEIELALMFLPLRSLKNETMARYFLKLSYKGTNYHGWQIQDNANTVQQEVNTVLSTVLNEAIQCTGCGRTDTGVHATEFYAHFDSDRENISDEETIFKLNGCLASDISIAEIWKVPPESNVR
ncbi:MAG TPA: hypothetical protein EYO31_05740, partial [Phycisphaerales bacterium]|nr:hypothetical protein [Phycisphaerales bacterium]